MSDSRTYTYTPEEAERIFEALDLTIARTVLGSLVIATVITALLIAVVIIGEKAKRKWDLHQYEKKYFGGSQVTDRCPHCGGRSGYYVTSVVTHRYFFGWDGSENGEGEPREHHQRHTVRRCIDCERRIEASERWRG